MSTNMLPADELFVVRKKIKDLQDREAELKNGIRSGEMPAQGAFCIAFIKERASKRFDRKAAEAELGDLSRFEKASTATLVMVEELPNPDAA